MASIHEINEDWQQHGLAATWLKLQKAQGEYDALACELKKWRDVFGHLGTADECGNEWVRLQERIAELERLCDATYVAQGADAYHHACSEMERFQVARQAAEKNPGTTGSLCDGIAWLYQELDRLEAALSAAPAAQPITDELATCVALLEDWVTSFVDSIEGGEADELVAATRSAIERHHGINENTSAAPSAQPMQPLWAIYVPGPDEVHAAPSEDAAHHMAAKHNAAMEQFFKAHPDKFTDEALKSSARASVCKWTHDAESHAEELKEFDFNAWGLSNTESAAPAAQPEPVAWLVCSVNKDGSYSLEYAAAWREAAHAHIDDAVVAGIEGAATWVVRPAYIKEQP